MMEISLHLLSSFSQLPLFSFFDLFSASKANFQLVLNMTALRDHAKAHKSQDLTGMIHPVLNVRIAQKRSSP